MNKVLRKYTHERLVLCILIMLVALTHGCSKDPAKDPSDNPPAPIRPEITTIDPGHAVPGTEITITGKHFHEDRLRNYVYFAGTSREAFVSRASTTSLKVIIPEEAVTGKVIVKVNNLADTSASDLIVDPIAFTITGFQPKQGPFGTIVTIDGTHFEDGMAVKINNLVTPIKRRTATQIEVEIPINTSLTAHKLSITSGSITQETAEPFTVTSQGPYGRWENKNIVLASNGSILYQGGLSFVHGNRIYWGFTNSTSASNLATYVVFDPGESVKGWQAQPPPPAQLAPVDWQHATAVVHNGHVYMGSGLTASGESKKWWEFHPATNTATALTDFPHAVMKPVSFVLQDKIYIGFGSDNKNLYRFDPAANNGKGQFHHITTGAFSDLLWGTGFILDNEVYLGRALEDITGARKAVYKFTTPDQLVRIADMPTDLPSLGMSAFTLGSKGYFVIDKQVWEFTPGTSGGSWRAVIAETNAPAIQHVAQLTINGAPAIYGWSATGRLYEFKYN